MGKNWMMVGAVLAMVVLAAVLVAAVPAAKPDQGDGTQLFTLVDSVELPARTSMTYEFVDVQGFSQFRGFFTWESGSAAAGNINIHFLESFDGTNSVKKDPIVVSGRADVSELAFLGDYRVHFDIGAPGLQGEFGLDLRRGPFRYLAAEFSNDSDAAQTVSVFLLAKP